MKSSKWPNFLFTVGVRFVCGFVLGGLACFLFFWRGVLRASAHGHHAWVPIWLGICAVIGGIVAVGAIPRWQTPWYKRPRLDLSKFPGPDSGNWTTPGGPVVEKSVSIKVTGVDGVERTYGSMEEAPPELRAEIEASLREAGPAKGLETSSVQTANTGDGLTVSYVRRKEVSLEQPGKITIYKVVDGSGTERIYHSLEEMPAELREAYLARLKKSSEPFG